jgi:DNA-binding CsgD family transcriptional regulator
MRELTVELGAMLGRPVLVGVGDRAQLTVVQLEDPHGLLTRDLQQEPSSLAGMGSAAQGLYPLPLQAMFDLVYRPKRVSRGVDTVARLIGDHADPATVIGRFLPGFDDDLGIHAQSGTQRLTVCVPVRRGLAAPMHPRERNRLQRHLAGAFASRLSPAWDSDAAVVNEQGRILCDAGALEKLGPRAAAIAQLCARELQQPGSLADGLELWDQLWKGGWDIAEVEHYDGRRYVVLRRTREPKSRLSVAERTVLEHARRGLPLKVIANDLGLSLSTASTQLHAGLAKLGLSHRLLLHKLA